MRKNKTSEESDELVISWSLSEPSKTLFELPWGVIKKILQRFGEGTCFMFVCQTAFLVTVYCFNAKPALIPCENRALRALKWTFMSFIKVLNCKVQTNDWAVVICCLYCSLKCCVKDAI